MSNIQAGLKTKNKYKFPTVISARFDGKDEDDQAVDEIELYKKLNINHNSTRTDFDNIVFLSQLQRQIQN